jgi:hypothetical protein
MKKLLISFCVVTASLAGCVSMNGIPATGYDTVKGQSHYIIPAADERGGLENDRTNMVYSVSVPFYKW